MRWTTGYEDTSKLEEYCLDHGHRLAGRRASIPGSPRCSSNRKVPEHAELHLLLSMITPLGWLERVPSYKDQQAQLADRDLSNYGFLGYPLLQRPRIFCCIDRNTCRWARIRWRTS